MKRKIKRLWKLYQELRKLRKVSTEIVKDCNEAIYSLWLVEE